MRVAIVGCGAAGITAAAAIVHHRLLESTVSELIILEAAPEPEAVGGIFNSTRVAAGTSPVYPFLRANLPTALMDSPLLTWLSCERQQQQKTNRDSDGASCGGAFPGVNEISAYLREIFERFELKRFLICGVRVLSLRHSGEDKGEGGASETSEATSWIAKCSDGIAREFDVVLCCVGRFSRSRVSCPVRQLCAEAPTLAQLAFSGVTEVGAAAAAAAAAHSSNVRRWMNHLPTKQEGGVVVLVGGGSSARDIALYVAEQKAACDAALCAASSNSNSAAIAPAQLLLLWINRRLSERYERPADVVEHHFQRCMARSGGGGGRAGSGAAKSTEPLTTPLPLLKDEEGEGRTCRPDRASAPSSTSSASFKVRLCESFGAAESALVQHLAQNPCTPSPLTDCSALLLVLATGYDEDAALRDLFGTDALTEQLVRRAGLGFVGAENVAAPMGMLYGQVVHELCRLKLLRCGDHAGGGSGGQGQLPSSLCASPRVRCGGPSGELPFTSVAPELWGLATPTASAAPTPAAATAAAAPRLWSDPSARQRLLDVAEQNIVANFSTYREVPLRTLMATSAAQSQTEREQQQQQQQQQ